MELVLIGVGLSMDAFAVALCKGLSMRRINYAHAAVIALFFGVFQAVMPLIGWVLGTQFARYITSVDHWIAFALLGYIGGKMIWDAFHEAPESETCASESTLNLRELLMLAVCYQHRRTGGGHHLCIFEGKHRSRGAYYRLYHLCAVLRGRGGRQPLWHAVSEKGGNRGRNGAGAHRFENPVGAHWAALRESGHVLLVADGAVKLRSEPVRVLQRLQALTGR